ncbi:MAG: hypothetical protein KBD65_02765 [Candidatus Moranbacteria bacterium]|nr:hypothetical protein [Candidatus Moranbacteria bacterium]
MRELLQKYKASSPLVVMLVLLSGIGLLAWFGIIPFQQFIVEKADGIQEYYATRENREQQMKKLPELQGQFENIEKDEKALAILLSEDVIVDFVRTLERLADETKVHITIRSSGSSAIEDKKTVKVPVKKAAPATDVAVKDGKVPQSLIETLPVDRFLHVTVVTQGEYKDIVAFLHKMETLPLGLDVIGVGVKLRTEEEKSVRPDNPGRNPFLILSGGDTALPVQQPEEEVIPGNLEASFDTVVYLDNK